MSTRRRPLTLAEHERLGEMLFQAHRLLWDVYNLAAEGCTVQELACLERLCQPGGALDKVTSTLDSKLFADRRSGAVPLSTLTDAYYGAEKRVKTRVLHQKVPVCQ